MVVPIVISAFIISDIMQKQTYDSLVNDARVLEETNGKVENIDWIQLDSTKTNISSFTPSEADMKMNVAKTDKVEVHGQGRSSCGGCGSGCGSGCGNMVKNGGCGSGCGGGCGSGCGGGGGCGNMVKSGACGGCGSGCGGGCGNIVNSGGCGGCGGSGGCGTKFEHNDGSCDDANSMDTPLVYVNEAGLLDVSKLFP